MEELWKPVNGYEGLYEVSNTGFVRRLGRVIKTSKGHTQKFPGRVLKPYRGFVSLSLDSKVKDFKVDVLVAESFIENLYGYDYLSHIDGDINNCSAYNLCWGPAIRDQSDEMWEDIPGYEGYYQASRDGRIRSVVRTVEFERNGEVSHATYQSVELSPVLNRDGYYSVMLSVDGKTKNPNVHYLVAKTFIFNPDNKPQVNHKDGNKTNNDVSNLEWSTRSENMQHAKRMGLWNPDKCGEASRKSTGIPVICVTTGKTFESISQAARECGMDDQSVKESIKLQRSRKGLQFQYMNNEN